MTDILEYWSRYKPKKQALKDGETGREFSYSELSSLADRIALNLKNRFQIGSGDRIAVLAQNELEYVALFFASLRLGGILVPINIRLAAPEVEHLLQDCQPKVLIFQREFECCLSKINLSSLQLPKLSFEEMACDSPAKFDALSIKQEAPCMILYTSGTTGKSKGALITYQMIFWNAMITTLRLKLTENDRFVGFLPFFHTGGWNVLLFPLLHLGASAILIRKFDPDLVLGLSINEKATLLFGVPTTFDRMSRTKLFETFSSASLKFAICGGEAMPLDLIRLWEKKGIAIRQGYGLTEFGPNVFSLNESDSISKIGSIGFPNPFIKTKIISEMGEEIFDGRSGELLLQGPVCTPGYWKNKEETEKTIRDGWLYTGDLVRRDAEGYFYVVGRKKDMYISGGENVYPAEIEQVLQSHPKVHEAAVVGVSDSTWGETGKAFVALNTAQDCSPTEILQYCTERLAKYKVPKYIEFVNELPKGDSGKILKAKLSREIHP